MFSLVCSFILCQIHWYVIESNIPQQVNQQQEQLKKQKIKIGKKEQEKISHEAWVITAIICVGYATIHGFYPNFSKFLQQNYGFTNVEAGHLASIPYVLASVMVPVLG
jgi:nitrate/nitrite transporter NarK